MFARQRWLRSKGFEAEKPRMTLERQVVSQVSQNCLAWESGWIPGTPTELDMKCVVTSATQRRPRPPTESGKALNLGSSGRESRADVRATSEVEFVELAAVMHRSLGFVFQVVEHKHSRSLGSRNIRRR